MKDALSYPESLILLAEDDEDFFVITRYALEQAGFAGELELVDNCKKLTDYLQDRKTPALIILDLKSVPEDWRAVLRWLKEHELYKTIPVVVLSASNDPEDILLCESYLKCSYVQKPLTFEDWKACMERIIRSNLPPVDTGLPGGVSPTPFHPGAEQSPT